MNELTALLTPESLRLIDETGPIASSDDALRAVTKLRRVVTDPTVASAVVTQARLRTRAAAKFGPFASRMLFTQAGLEQATRIGIAALHAGRFRSAGISHVIDLGCGNGGDAMAFAGADMRVTAVDADEVTAGIAAYNLAVFGDDARVLHARAEDITPADGDGVWFDPARRTSGHSETRRVQASDYSPSLDLVFDTARRHATGVKLGPGFDRDMIPDDAEAQWVSDNGSVVELVLWFGALARTGIRRAALVVRDGARHEITASADADDAAVRELGAFIHEPDGAVIRARLIGDVARSLNAGMLDEHIAYLTGDDEVTSPFVSSFRVREVVPFDAKPLSKLLRERGIGTLEIKKRGVDIDPAAFRKKLSLKGKEQATLFLTRVGDTRLAVLADRI